MQHLSSSIENEQLMVSLLSFYLWFFSHMIAVSTFFSLPEIFFEMGQAEDAKNTHKLWAVFYKNTIFRSKA